MRYYQRLASAMVALGLAGLAGSAAAQGAPEGYHLERVLKIPGSATGWDYNAIDEQHRHIFIAHRKDGLQVFDIKSGQVIKSIGQSAGANTAALAPEFDLGLAGTTDGAIVLFKLSTLKTLARYASTTSGFDGASYDAVSQRFAVVGEADMEKHSTPVLFFDGRSGRPLGTLLLDSTKVDAPRPDGKGNFYLPLRDQAVVAKIDGRGMRLAATMALKDCLLPAALEIDAAQQRLFVGCRGKGAAAPALAVLDLGSGRQLATLPIGRGVDEVLYDSKAQAIMTANGDDGSMTVIRPQPDGQYRVTATIGTRPRARTGVLDPVSGKIYLVQAEYIDTYPEGQETVTSYLANTFSVLTYSK